MSEAHTLEEQNIHSLLQLTLAPGKADFERIFSLTPAEREDFLRLADSHHVVLRALVPIARRAAVDGNMEVASWSEAAIAAEQLRIENALDFLQRICGELEAAGCPATVIKTLEHQPDLGNDLDLYTCAEPQRIVRILVNKFQAGMEPRSWGDRLANKWNFAMPGLKESVEFHIQRLGQTGEHIALAQRFVARRVSRQIGGRKFFVPAPEEAVVVATLQRMYRHFYFRVCDIVNTINLVDLGSLDFAELRRSAEPAGIWPGVATYLAIVSDYSQKYRGTILPLPEFVRQAAGFGGEKIRVRARFLRVPIMPEGAQLFTRQVTHAALSGDVPATLRLNLLPPLALAAAVAYRLTGSDKGVW